MKTKFTFTLILFAFMAFTATAQTAAKKQDEEQKIKYWVPTKLIPVSEHYEGGQDSLYKFVDKQLKYPLTARRNRIQGEVVVSFTLNEDGSTHGFRVLKNLGGGISEEALRIAQLIKFKAPGYASVVSLPIMFKL
jgi:periplasmic protein TonB